MVYGQTNSVETANEYAVFVQPSYQMSNGGMGTSSAAGIATPSSASPSGSRKAWAVSFGAMQGPKQFLALDVGFSFFQQDFTSGTSSSFPTARGQVLYKYAFTPKTYIQNTFVYLPNLDDGNDYRINNELALVAPVAGPIALKASYVLQYQNAPQPGFGTTDNLYTTGLQLVF